MFLPLICSVAFRIIGPLEPQLLRIHSLGNIFSQVISPDFGSKENPRFLVKNVFDSDYFLSLEIGFFPFSDWISDRVTNFIIVKPNLVGLSHLKSRFSLLTQLIGWNQI